MYTDSSTNKKMNPYLLRIKNESTFLSFQSYGQKVY